MIPKYRAWLKDEKTMHEVISIDFHNESVDVKDNVSAMPWHNYDEDGDAILMQSTGLTDKNGVEIFEGDIVNCPDWGIGTVVFDGRRFGISNKPEQIFTWYQFSRMTGYDFIPKILGNIHQNPELLEEK